MSAAKGEEATVDVLAENMVLTLLFNQDKLKCHFFPTLWWQHETSMEILYVHRGRPLWCHWVEFFPSVKLQNGSTAMDEKILPEPPPTPRWVLHGEISFCLKYLASGGDVWLMLLLLPIRGLNLWRPLESDRQEVHPHFRWAPYLTDMRNPSKWFINHSVWRDGLVHPDHVFRKLRVLSMNVAAHLTRWVTNVRKKTCK